MLQFKRPSTQAPGKEELLRSLQEFGFKVQEIATGKLRVERDGCAAIVSLQPGAKPLVERIGLVRGDDIAICIHGGYQLFFETSDGRKEPALAEELKVLHNFEEDLLEALGLESLYNLSLGTICSKHQYDRLEDRDKPERPPKPWELKKMQKQMQKGSLQAVSS